MKNSYEEKITSLEFQLKNQGVLRISNEFDFKNQPLKMEDFKEHTQYLTLDI